MNELWSTFHISSPYITLEISTPYTLNRFSLRKFFHHYYNAQDLDWILGFSVETQLLLRASTLLLEKG